ncbi:hypothetical protein Lgra_1225 [Legionella gratiana]|uniref:Uncharacterized protein n=1 Tax=Legionella gratiana TaxID=45066 RepID=A0A378JC42_9GAMM|nr:hypothetical protein [Legionella gratiana]KTD11767.1 hypothetical protein Lgra_1225 [Legionella gratiana]STX45444.1 Uncharacterised protein [Legionella gratiana]
MFLHTYVYLIVCIVSGFIAYKATNPTYLLIARVVFSVSLIALLAHSPHPEDL